MIKEEWKQIQQKQDIRQNLSKIRQQLKEKENMDIFMSLIQEDADSLIHLLEAEDAKTRKNTALLMGDTGKQEFMEPLFLAYLKEEQRFIKGAYLTALGKFRYQKYLPQLKERQELLSKEDVTLENQKHQMEELKELSALIVKAEGIKVHPFTGWNHPFDIVLLTNRNFTEYTRDELMEMEPDTKAKVFNAGVQARVTNLHWLQDIRTYQEILFVVKGMETAPMDASILATKIVESNLLPWLCEIHRGEYPFYFRVEMKSKRPLDERSDFVKKLSGQIERLSERRLINTTKNYEIELRLVENKEGSCNLLVRLYTIRDERFSYRKEVIPTSIKPVNGALTVALVKDYLKEDGQVLDPFCGVGTMLIERHKAVRANTTYGLDIQEDAIIKARENTANAGQLIHYINRDFFKFEHEYLFDEVITNMPFQIGRTTAEDVTALYEKFFQVVPKYLKDNAVMILYSHDKKLVERLARENGFIMIKSFEISKKEGTYVQLLRRGGLS